MNPDHARFAEWDAAYVLGALSSADRREYEEHLVECAECRRAVAELTPTVGLLSRITSERAETIGSDDGPEPDARAGVISLARHRARRRRIWWVAAAAAVLIVAAVTVPVGFAVTAPAPTVAMTAVADVPIEADLRLTDVAWGTRIDVDCRYTAASPDAPAEGWPYALAVVSTDGTSSTVSTWRARPETTARLSAGTAVALEDVQAVEIVAEASGKVLMRYEPPGRDR